MLFDCLSYFYSFFLLPFINLLEAQRSKYLHEHLFLPSSSSFSNFISVYFSFYDDYYDCEVYTWYEQTYTLNFTTFSSLSENVNIVTLTCAMFAQDYCWSIEDERDRNLIVCRIVKCGVNTESAINILIYTEKRRPRLHSTQRIGSRCNLSVGAAKLVPKALGVSVRSMCVDCGGM